MLQQGTLVHSTIHQQGWKVAEMRKNGGWTIW